MVASQKIKLLAIVGPTASGKTGLAISLAKKIGGEVICADSRTIYKGMDIGTAKPSSIEQDGIVHHALDLLNPDQAYSAVEFKALAQSLVGDIQSRGKIPIVVGGTGLYVWALLYDYLFPAGADNEQRRELEDKPLDELCKQLSVADPDAFKEVDLANKRRVIRAIETAGRPREKRRVPIEGAQIVGICPSMKMLEQRIQGRTHKMIQDGLIEEVKYLVGQYGDDVEPLRSVGYREVREYLAQEYDDNKMEQLISLHTRQLAKRQLTWFRRSKDIRWYDDAELAEKTLLAEMN